MGNAIKLGSYLMMCDQGEVESEEIRGWSREKKEDRGGGGRCRQSSACRIHEKESTDGAINGQVSIA